MPLSKEEAEREEADIVAQEQRIKERWCALKGHRWDLPQPNPLNSDSLTCGLRCGRCNVPATLTISIQSPAPPPAPAAKGSAK
jgi:hypothetical protein